MADISISKSRGKKYLGGASPMVPAFIVGDDPIPLNPPGSGGGGGFFGVGAGLSLDDTQKVQLGKLIDPFEDETNIFTFIDLNELGASGILFSYYETISSLSIDKESSTISAIRELDRSLMANISLRLESSEQESGVLTAGIYDLLFNFNGFALDKFSSVFGDSINSKGLEYPDDYSANWTAHSLVTKQYVDGAISGAGHLPVTIGSPANGLSISGTQVLSIGLASSIAIGALSSTDWSTFNGKLNLTSLLTGYVVGANTAISASNTILTAFQQVQGQINARVSGTIALGQVAFGTGVNTVGGDSGLVWDNINKRLLVGAGTAASLIQASNSSSTGIITWDTRTNFAFVRIHADSVNENLLNWGTGTSLRFATSSTAFGTFLEVARLNATGLGIGTSPTNAIDVLRNIAGAASITLRNTNTGSTSTSRLILTNDASNATFSIIQRNSNDATSPNAASFGTTFSHSLSLFTASTDRLHITSAGLIGINIITPTNTLDVNGTARIRTISNGVGDFLTKSATGVITSRTAAEVVTDLSPSFDSRYVKTSGNDTKTALNNTSTNVLMRFQTLDTTPILEIWGDKNKFYKQIELNSAIGFTTQTGATPGNALFYWNSALNNAFTLAQNGSSYFGYNGGQMQTVKELSFRSTWGGTETGRFTSTSGRFFHARSGQENESIIRNEKYLNTSENVVTAGAINNQAITDGIFNQRFTLATSITGHANGENGKELTINNANTVSCDLVYESASSTAANRYYFATLANLTIPSRGIVTLIYNSTVSRWELKSKNF